MENKRNENAAALISDYLASRPEVQLGYLFGSTARKQTHRQSDLDLAVLVDQEQYRRLDREAPWGYLASLNSALMGLLQRNDIDLVLLHLAPTLLRHEVVRRGQLLFCRDEKVRVDFEVDTRRTYLDTQHLRHIQRAYLYADIEQGRFGRSEAGA